MASDPTKPPIALVFDFDDTLAPDCTSKVIEAIGIDPVEFWAEHRELLEQGWDQVPAFMTMMLRESNERGGAITRELIQQVGSETVFFRGVPSMFKRYKKLIEEGSGFRAQFFVISSGFGDLIRATPIASKLTDIWGSDFAYDASGAICAIKNVISFTDKTRCLFQISKGLVGPAARKNQFAVNERTTQFPTPFTNMIYVGDGYTDIPCFTIVQKSGGQAIAAYDQKSRAKIGRAYGFINDRRVNQIAPAVFAKGSGADAAISSAIVHLMARATGAAN